tara:strand:- start:177 stop:299 length:123 start_codon:yes stop_codon:yes gene_type:complete
VKGSKFIFFKVLIFPSEISPTNNTKSGLIEDKMSLSASDH